MLINQWSPPNYENSFSFRLSSGFPVELVYEILPTYATQLVEDGTPLLWLVPEEEQTLRQLLLFATGTEYRLHRIGMITRVPNFGRYRHGSGREVLYLLQVEIQPLGNDGQLCHVFLTTSRMTGNEIWDELLTKSCLLIDTVEQLLESFKQLKRRLAHDAKHAIGGMFGSHLKPSTDVPSDELACIVTGGFIQFGFLVRVQEQVIAHTAPDERLLDTRQGIHRAVNIKQRAMISIQVGTYRRMETRRTLALAAQLFVPSFHAVHIGAGSTQIAQIAFEVGKLHDGLHLAQDAFLGAADYELALVGRDGTECASSETSTMDIDGELDHVIRRNTLALILGMWQTGIGQVERMIQLGFRQRRKRRIDHHRALRHALQHAAGFVLVALLLDVTKIRSLFALVLQALFVRVEQDVFLAYRDIICQVSDLGDITCQR